MTRQKSILITGCSSGIGLYCAQQLKRDGWQVFATARQEADIKRLQKEGLNGIYLDYTNSASIAKAFADVMKITNGTLDALFNNGAYGQPGAVEDLPTDALRQQFEANFFGWHELTNLALPVMRKQGHGRIIHCSSILGFVPLAWRGAYNASKYALEGLATTMRLELHATPIHVSLIEPGPIASKFTANSLPHFLEHIDRKNSAYKAVYEKQLERLKSGGGKDPFRLGPHAVYKKLVLALNAKNPKAHYLVTTPTYVAAIARRILPQFLLEKLLLNNA